MVLQRTTRNCKMHATRAAHLFFLKILNSWRWRCGWRRWCWSSQISRLMLYLSERYSAFIWTFVILPIRWETLWSNPLITRISFRHSQLFLMVKTYIINCVWRRKSILTKYRTFRSHPSIPRGILWTVVQFDVFLNSEC